MADETMTLLPCPFCGHRVDNIPETPFPTTRARDCWAARCGNPYCGAQILGATPEEATARWNRRESAIAERKVPEWQPIETAPKGNAVLIYYTNEFGNERIVKALYIERFTEEAEPASENDEYNEADDTYYTLPGWYEMIDNWGDYSSVAIHHNPSHWMPLPEGIAERGKVPDGWKLVPSEPTSVMNDAAMDYWRKASPSTYAFVLWENLYKAMLVAAPEPPK